jgi:hypothetical protein
MAERIVPVVTEKTVALTDWIPSGDWDQPQGSIERDGGVLLEAHQVDGSEKIAYKVCTTYPECKPCINNATCPVAPIVAQRKAFK